MEIRWLEAFIAVAEELHFSKAATRLYMAQSPLSQMIRRLERELGQKLFERNTRSVELTAAGQSLLPHARAIVARSHVARQAVSASEGEIVGTVRLGLAGVLNHFAVPRLTKAVHEQLPHVTLDLIGRVLTKDAIEQLNQGTLDLAYVGLPVNQPGIHTWPIKSEGFGVVLPESHPLAVNDIIDLRDLADEGFVSTPETAGSVYRESMTKLCAEAGFSPRIIQEVTDPYVVLLLVAAGIGVTITTEGLEALTPPGAVHRPICQGSVMMEHGIAWSAGEGSAARDAVVTIAKQVFAAEDFGGVGEH